MWFPQWCVLTCAGAVVPILAINLDSRINGIDTASRLQAGTFTEDYECEESVPVVPVAPVKPSTPVVPVVPDPDPVKAGKPSVPVKPAPKFETKTRPAPILKVLTKTAPAIELPKIVVKPKEIKSPQITVPVAVAQSKPESAHHDPRWEKMRKDLLDAHNLIRKAHGLPLFTWSDKLAAYAQKWSNKCIYEHSNGPDYGENLALGYYFDDIRYAVKAFYDELKTFDWSHGAFDETHGHVSQLLWDETTQLGCALTKCPSLNNQGLLFCEYDPPGNVINNIVDPTPEETKEFRSHMRKRLPGSYLPAWLLADNP